MITVFRLPRVDESMIFIKKCYFGSISWFWTKRSLTIPTYWERSAVRLRYNRSLRHIRRSEARDVVSLRSMRQLKSVVSRVTFNFHVLPPTDTENFHSDASGCQYSASLRIESSFDEIINNPGRDECGWILLSSIHLCTRCYYTAQTLKPRLIRWTCLQMSVSDVLIQNPTLWIDSFKTSQIKRREWKRNGFKFAHTVTLVPLKTDAVAVSFFFFNSQLELWTVRLPKVRGCGPSSRSQSRRRRRRRRTNCLGSSATVYSLHSSREWETLRVPSGGAANVWHIQAYDIVTVILQLIECVSISIPMRSRWDTRRHAGTSDSRSWSHKDNYDHDWYVW